MPVESLSASAHDVSMYVTPAPHPVLPGFEERWAAWRARGAAHDRAVRRRLAIAVPTVAAVAAVAYLLLAR
jgi:hypothetical protein